jgi:hypothetical protein
VIWETGQSLSALVGLIGLFSFFILLAVIVRWGPNVFSDGQLASRVLLISTLVGILGVILLPAMLLQLLRNGATRTVFFERGVRSTNRRGSRTIHFANADIKYLVRPMGSVMAHWLYIFDAREESQKPIFASAVEKPDGDVEKLIAVRDHIIPAITERMLSEIRAGRQVKWGKFVLDRNGAAGSPPIPWSQFRSADQASRQRSVHVVNDSAAPFLTLPMQERNSYPVWNLSRILTAEQDPSPGQVTGISR